MDEEKRPQESDRPDRSQLTGVENFYENFRKIPLKYLDIFIWACIAALVLVIALGVLNR